MKTLWAWLDGKKVIIGAIAANVLPWVMLKGYITHDTAEMLLGVVNIITGVGLAHKAGKALAASDAP